MRIHNTLIAHGFKAKQGQRAVALCPCFWWRQQNSNLRPLACEASALPAELCLHITRSEGENGDPYETRTRVTAVKGRCLNHLTNGPKAGQPTCPK